MLTRDACRTTPESFGVRRIACIVPVWATTQRTLLTCGAPLPKEAALQAAKKRGQRPGNPGIFRGRQSEPAMRRAAAVKLMGYSQLVRGHVGGVAHGINAPNAQPDPAGLASVNPIFTWVRLAQRVPVRIHIDQVPDGVRLVAGMTATVRIDPQPKPSGR